MLESSWDRAVSCAYQEMEDSQVYDTRMESLRDATNWSLVAPPPALSKRDYLRATGPMALQILLQPQHVELVWRKSLGKDLRIALRKQAVSIWMSGNVQAQWHEDSRPEGIFR